MTTPTTLESLLIERACERLITEFFEAVDLRDEARLDALFTEDATYARPIAPDAIISGREAIRKSFEARPAGRVGRHTCSNVRINVESAERATGVHRVVLYMGPEQSPDPQFGYKADARVLIGEFADVFVKTPHGWRFQSRRGRVILHT
jgi:ketosteroid isomerase-like protein